MAKFGIGAEADDTTTGITTSLSAHANATQERGEAVEAIMTGSGSTAAADIQHRAELIGSDGTGQGTGTAETAEPFDSMSAASVMGCLSDHATEPSVFAAGAWVQFGFNQRGGMRWAVPKGEGPKWYADSAAGAEDTLCLTVISSAVGNVDSNVHWWEP